MGRRILMSITEDALEAVYKNQEQFVNNLLTVAGCNSRFLSPENQKNLYWAEQTLHLNQGDKTTYYMEVGNHYGAAMWVKEPEYDPQMVMMNKGSMVDLGNVEPGLNTMAKKQGVDVAKQFYLECIEEAQEMIDAARKAIEDLE